MNAILAAAVTLWFLVSAGYAAGVGLSAVRTRTYARRLGLDVQGPAAVAAGWATLVLAAALLAAGALVAFVAMRG